MSEAETRLPTQELLAAVNTDPKWLRRQRVIEALTAYKRKLDTRVEARARYEALCARLYSGRSSKITGVPINHDQFAAQDHFAQMLDEKMELERAMAENSNEEDEMAALLAVLDDRDRAVIKEFYLSDVPTKAMNYLCGALELGSAQVYRIRDNTLDELADLLGLADEPSVQVPIS